VKTRHCRHCRDVSKTHNTLWGGIDSHRHDAHCDNLWRRGIYTGCIQVRKLCIITYSAQGRKERRSGETISTQHGSNATRIQSSAQ